MPLPPLKSEPGKLPANDVLLRRINAQLDLEVEFVKTLSLWQINNGLSGFVHEQASREFDRIHPAYNWRPFAHISGHTASNYKFVQFYASLSPELRQSLLNGRLAFTDLNANQQQSAFYLLPELKYLLMRPPTQPVLLDIKCEIPKIEGAMGDAPCAEPVRLFEFSLVFALNNQ